MVERSVLASLVALSARRASAVLLVGAVLAGLSAVLAMRLSVTTDINGLFNANLPWKQRESELKRLFPQREGLLVAVIDAAVPEAAEATAAGLAAALARDTEHFQQVRRPDASPFFDQNGLLFLDTPALSAVLDQTIDAQPFLGQLVADPSARGLFAALSLVAIGVDKGAELGPFGAPLRGFHEAMVSTLRGEPQPLSWQRLLAGPVAEMGGSYRFVLAQPRLDFAALQPGAAATQALRDAAAEQEFVRSGLAHVRVTGAVALSDEELASAANGAVAGLIGSTLLVVVWLVLAVRSWRLVVPIVLTLMLGLLLTTAFAALTTSPLNMISVAFAILFVGIAVEFAIQFSVRLREAQTEAPDLRAALAVTGKRAGVQILVAAAATAAGFLAFVPTDFSGVAELGLIAGAGMLIAFACTLVFLPAALVVFRPRTPGREVGFAWAAPLDRWLARRRWLILALSGIAAGFGLLSLPRLTFDSDPLHLKNASTEAMQTLADLAANPLTNPYTIDVLAPDAAAAQAVTAAVQKLPLVAQVLSLQSFVPQDQPAKLALVADAAGLLAPTLAQRGPAAAVTVGDLRLAAHTALAQLQRVAPRLPPEGPLAAIASDLAALEAAGDETLLAANAALTRFLPQQIARLRAALRAGPVTPADVPPDIARDWVLPDGRMRVQVSAKPDAARAEGLYAFVDQVSAVAPDAGGPAPTITATAETITSAFKRAALGAIIAITLILFVALRRVLDVALVLAPLLLSALLTVIVAAWLPLPLNFANVIALPLLLGVGVSFNIYFVMNWRAGLRSHLASPTARAVMFSALTTATAFGSLALSGHPGTASMGALLLISLCCTLIASLVFVPALLATISSSRR